MDAGLTLLRRIDEYIEALFVPPDPALAEGLADAEAHGLPAIQVSATEGKLLWMLAALSGARRVLEIGTLGGYSTSWLARAIPPDGLVVGLEIDPAHAEVARRVVTRAAPGRRVDIVVGDATLLLDRMISNGERPFDFVFIDADKPGYPAYLERAVALSRPGTVIVADNVIRHGAVLAETPPDDEARAARAFNDALAAHPQLDSIVIPLMRQHVDGLSISIVRDRPRIGSR